MLKARAIWLFVEARVAWIAFVVLVVLLHIALHRPMTEQRIRIVAGIFQLLGIVTVALDIRHKRKDFGLPRLAGSFGKWISKWPSNHNGGEVRATLGGLHVESEGGHFVLTGNPANSSTEDRIRALEGNVAGLDKEVRHTAEVLRQETTGRKAALEEEHAARESEDTKIREKLVASQTGGLQLSAVGVLWLAVGTILGTLSKELVERLG